MASTSLSRPAPLITEELQARVQRGRQLFEKYASEIQFLENDVWLVPSCTGAGTSYLVNVRLERCECHDYEYRSAGCKHLVAASIANAKSRTCSCCSEKVLGRYTTEVTEEDGLLSFYPGDVLCADCVRAGFWV